MKILFGMASQIAVQGHSDLMKEIEKHSSEKEVPIFVFFSGSAQDNGESWCPDCVKGVSRLTLTSKFYVRY